MNEVSVIHLLWTKDEIMFDRITFEAKIMGGRACIRGMRIPVPVVVRTACHVGQHGTKS